MSIRLRLSDGREVSGEKDCECLDTIHTGPHWLYTDDIWRAANLKLRAAGNLRGYIAAELPRLTEKRWQMEHAGIIEILRDEET